MRDYWPIAERTFGVVSLGALFLSDGTLPLLYRYFMQVKRYQSTMVSDQLHAVRAQCCAHPPLKHSKFWLLLRTRTYMGCKKK